MCADARSPTSAGSYPPRDAAADAVLVGAVRSGDPEAFKRLYLEFHDRLLAYAYSILHSEQAKDVVQDVMARLWHHRTTWTVHGRLDVYLYRAVRYEISNAYRNTRRAERHHATFVFDEAELPGHGVTPLDPAAATDLAEMRVMLSHAVAALPAAERQAIVLHWWHGLSNREIAEITGRSPGAVAVAISRARETLRRTMLRAEG